MQATAFARQQLAVHRLAEQRMAEGEPVPIALDRNQDLQRQRLAEPLRQDRHRDAPGDGEDVGIDARPGGRGRPEHPAGRVGQAVEPGEQDLTERRWQRIRGTPDGDQLLRVVRVATRAGVDRRSQPGVRLVAEDGRDELADLQQVERLEVEPVHQPGPLELREERHEQALPAGIVRAIRRDQEDALGLQGVHEVRQQVECLPVGPLQVLEDEDERPRPGQPRQHAAEMLELPAARVARQRPHHAGVGQLGHEAREVSPRVTQDPVELARPQQSPEVTQRLDEGTEREAGLADGHAGAAEGACARGARRSAELGHQPRLADARLTGDEDAAARPAETSARAAWSRSSSDRRPTKIGSKPGWPRTDYPARIDAHDGPSARKCGTPTSNLWIPPDAGVRPPRDPDSMRVATTRGPHPAAGTASSHWRDRPAPMRPGGSSRCIAVCCWVRSSPARSSRSVRRWPRPGTRRSTTRGPRRTSRRTPTSAASRSPSSRR
jgi:hypothetical protein